MIFRCYPVSRDERSNRRTKLQSSHTGTSNAMGYDPKHYTESFHTPEHPTPHMESVSHAGTSNAASETDNLFFPHAGTSNAECGKSNTGEGTYIV
ncbi:hypothetical protein L3X38_011804 [Prunus dulcis]|uniref:Uncharacterized protein n=1 Tax=Prunus dulcis TaxID=3755 RepID=A0AAD4ZG17_PRUDU|nr:hypothetical protein L3X38_011804 [Prunus dulcis]